MLAVEAVARDEATDATHADLGPRIDRVGWGSGVAAAAKGSLGNTKKLWS